MGFQTHDKVPQVSVLFNFQGPARCPRLRDSLFIISQEVPFVKNFFEIFLKFFSKLRSFKKPSKAVVMRFSAALRVALAPDSLTIIPP